MKIALTATPSTARFAPILVKGNVREAFALAAEFGCSGVELHLRHASDVNPTQVKKLAEDYEMDIPTLGTGMAVGEDGLTFVDPDPDVRRKAVERVGEHIELAAQLDAAVTIGSLSGRIGADGPSREALRTAGLECLAEVCELAECAGVTILLEPLNRYECDHLSTVEQALSVIRKISAPNLKLLVDTFHANIEEADIAASLRQATSYLGHLHLVDSNREVPGHGHLDVGELLRTLADIGYHGYVSFECLPLPSPRQAISDGVRTVRSFV